MKRAVIPFLFPVFVIGVFGESVSVKEGDAVTLHTNTEIKTDDEIEWRFSTTRIARVIRKSDVYDDVVGFRDRLQVDIQTGDLKITNFSITDSGLYKFEIISPRGSSEKTFSVSGVRGTGVKPVLALVGDLVTLLTGVSEQQRDGVMQWRFEHPISLVAEINRKAGIFNTYDGADGRFRHRLQLDYLTGSLTIRNIGTELSGLYEVGIRSGSSSYTTHKSFNVTVSDAVKSELVKKRYSVTLHTVTEIQRHDLIMWMFEDTVIANIHKADQRFSTSDGPDGRFKDRLKLDNQTGSLTITNTRTTDSGFYDLKIISSRHTINRRFTVTVTALSPAAITGIVGVVGVVGVILVAAAVVVAAAVLRYHLRMSRIERHMANRWYLLNLLFSSKTSRREQMAYI